MPICFIAYPAMILIVHNLHAVHIQEHVAVVSHTVWGQAPVATLPISVRRYVLVVIYLLKMEAGELDTCCSQLASSIEMVGEVAGAQNGLQKFQCASG